MKITVFRLRKSIAKNNKKLRSYSKICQGTHGLPYTSEDVSDDYLMNWENVGQGKPQQA